MPEAMKRPSRQQNSVFAGAAVVAYSEDLELDGEEGHRFSDN